MFLGYVVCVLWPAVLGKAPVWGVSRINSHVRPPSLTQASPGSECLASSQIKCKQTKVALELGWSGYTFINKSWKPCASLAKSSTRSTQPTSRSESCPVTPVILRDVTECGNWASDLPCFFLPLNYTHQHFIKLKPIRLETTTFVKLPEQVLRVCQVALCTDWQDWTHM